METMSGERPGEISRRRMLRRIGAGAAIAWAAPVLTSLRLPAFAQAGSPACAECPADCSLGTLCSDVIPCACAGGPTACGCYSQGACLFEGGVICESDADCEPFLGSDARCAPCAPPFSGCGPATCWQPCGSGGGSVPSGDGVVVFSPGS